MRFLSPALLTAALTAAVASADAPTIEHTPVKCIVAGKYPKLEAAFAPSPVARARAYFRPEGIPSWYYVEMAPEAGAPAAYAGVLPKPTKKLVGKKIDYYLEAAAKTFDTGRTNEYDPLVVARREECKEQPVAAYASGPPPAVFPNLPQGFAMAGGIPVGAAVIVGGGAAAAGAVVILKDGDPDPTLPTTTTSTPTVTIPPTVPPPTTVASGLELACQAQPRRGVAPLRVFFNAQASGGTGVYDFVWTFGDGQGSNQVSPAHTYANAGTYLAAVVVTSGPLSAHCERDVVVDPLVTEFDLTVQRAGSGTGTVTGPGIACGADCGETYAAGTIVQLTAEATGGSAFVGWSGDCAGAGQCFVTMDQARSVTATFGVLSTLTVATAGAGSGLVTGPGISCQEDCQETYLQGTAVTLNANPQVGSSFQGWSGACSGTGACNLIMSGAVNVTATFQPITPQLTVIKAGSGAAAGAVVGPGIDCGTDCSETYPFGTNVTVAPSPVPSSPPVAFDGWSGDCSGGGACSVLMTAARTVTATFTRLFNLSVTVNTPNRGSVTSNPPGIDCGAGGTDCFFQYRDTVGNVTLTAVAEPDFFFINWTGDCTGTQDTCVVNMNANRGVVANFNSIPTRPGTGATPGGGTLRWSSQLDAAGSWGRVVGNGADAGASPPGVTQLSIVRRAGDNRVEAQLQAGGGRDGTWRFELLDKGAVEPGSLRAIEGEVMLVTEEAIVFKVAGRPGERLVFTFRPRS